MIKDYGLLAANSKKQAPFQKDTDDHVMKLKRVSMSNAHSQRAGYNVMLSDIASPRESRVAHL